MTRVLAVLPDLLDKLSETASPSTVRQREWAVTAALEHYTAGGSLHAMARVTVAELLEPSAVEDYLQSSAEGRLRKRSPALEHAREESLRTTSARASALRWLATATQHRKPQAVHPGTELISPTRQLADQTRLATSALIELQSVHAHRSAAAIAIVAATGLSSEAVTGMTLADLKHSIDTYWVRVEPRDPLPAAWWTHEDETYARIPTWGYRAMTAWLKDRKHVVARLEGTDHGRLFVACAPNGTTTKPGMPLHYRGLARGHQKAAQRLLATHPDLDPPRRLSTVRRLAEVHWLQPPVDNSHRC